MDPEPIAAGPAEEAGWIREIAQGDRDAFERLHAVYAPRVFRYMIRMLGDPAVAEEATSDVMFEIWKGAGRFEGRSKPSTWIFGIAHYKALNERRKRRPRAEDVETANPVDPREGADTTADRGRLAQRVRLALGELSPDHREVVELTFFHGCSYPEIAKITGVPLGTVKTRMFHAKKILRPVLEQEGIAEEAS